VRVCVILSLLAGLALSPKLWLNDRAYPLTPVWTTLVLDPLANRLVFFALIALLLALLVLPRPPLFAAAFAAMLVLAVQDQSRWQPWFYQYALMLLAIALAGPGRAESARNTCRLMIVATYIWSGLAKLNPVFQAEAFPWLIGPLVHAWPTLMEPLRHAPFLGPVLEIVAGVGLLTVRFRRAALAVAIAIHVFVLVMIGPGGLNFNRVVWPWNIAMVGFGLILFYRPAEPFTWRDVIWGGAFRFQKVVLALCAVAPILCFFGLWDDYLSSALYSGNNNYAVIDFDDAVRQKLPPEIRTYATTYGPNRYELDFDAWSLGEMHVPSYPELRIYRNVTRQLCRDTQDDNSMELVVESKLTLTYGSKHSVYRCSGLR
jgi:hypothetical protein